MGRLILVAMTVLFVGVAVFATAVKTPYSGYSVAELDLIQREFQRGQGQLSDEQQRVHASLKRERSRRVLRTFAIALAVMAAVGILLLPARRGAAPEASHRPGAAPLDLAQARRPSQGLEYNAAAVEPGATGAFGADARPSRERRAS